jgi:oxidoreductase
MENLPSPPSISFRTIVFCANGAVGRELIDYLLKSNKYSKITIIVRKKIDKWNTYSNDEKSILNIIELESLDFLINDLKQIENLIPNIKLYNSIFSTLGSRVKKGKEEFNKVEKLYTIQILKICEEYFIQHFSYISSSKANKNSFFMLWKIKGETEEELEKINSIPLISIFRPGLLKERDNDKRLGESLVDFVPFFTKIKVKDVAKAMVINDITFLENYILFDKTIEIKNKIEKIENSNMIILSKKNL